MKYCVECGTGQEPGWKFCPDCGREKVLYRTREFPETVGATETRSSAGKQEQDAIWKSPVDSPASDAASVFESGSEPQWAPDAPAAPALEPVITLPSLKERRADRRGRGSRSHDPAEQSERLTEIGARKARRWPWVVVFLVTTAVAAGVVAAPYAAKQDAYTRGVEFEKLLDVVESSEEVMQVWQDRVDVLVRKPSPEIGAEIQTISAETLTALRDAERKVASVRINSWHNDVARVRNLYQQHQQAWIRYLEAVQEDPMELGNQIFGERIDLTFRNTCEAGAKVKPAVQYPNRSKSNTERWERICASAYAVS